MAGILVEMGATHLVEMGSSRFLAQATPSSPVLQVFRLVDYMEDPFKGIDLDPGETISSKQRAVADKLKMLSRLQRKNLLQESSLEGFSYSDVMSESMRMSAVLNGLSIGAYDDVFEMSYYELGKKKKGFFKKIGSKIVKVVKSPAFLTVLGVVANIVPGVGQIASAALLATAGIMAKKQQETKQKKSMKKAEQQAAVEASQQDEAALNAYYAQYGPTYLYNMGYTPDVWTKFSTAEKRKIIEALGAGTIQPYVSPEEAKKLSLTNSQVQQYVVQSAGLSQAMQQTYGNQLPGEGITAPPQLQPQVNAAASEYQRQIAASGKDNFLSTAIKAGGQAGAINALYEGSGSELPGGLKDVFGRVQSALPQAFDAGVQDMKNDAAAAGEGDVVGAALNRGTSSVPWVPILIGVGTLAGVGVVLAISR